MCGVSRLIRGTVITGLAAVLAAGMFASGLSAQESSSLWQDAAPASSGTAAAPGAAPISFAEQNGLSSYRQVSLDIDALEAILEPLRSGAAQQAVLELPLPSGNEQRFRIVPAPVMQDGLAAKFPNILTFAGQGLDDPQTTVRLDWSPRGFNAILLAADGTYFVAPEAGAPDAGGQGLHVSYDYRALPPFVLEGDDLIRDALDAAPSQPGKAYKAVPFAVGNEIRLYRAAIGAVGEFTQNVGGVNDAMAAIVTFVNQLNALWERDLAQRIVIVDGNEQLIFPDPATDPFVDNPGIFDNGANFDANQLLLDTVIGSENYDIGHLMLWNSNGGVAQFSVCQNDRKAKGQTGAGGSLNHLRTLAHEMGHQFYMAHTWNSEVCANTLFPGQHRPASSYEPGSGNTIMSYGGNCNDGMQDDNTGSRVFQYHSHSFDQMLTETVDGIRTCATVIDLGINTPPSVSAGSTAFTLPHSTPFVLAGSAVDAEGDLLTYSWEEIDLPVAPAAPADGEVPFFRIFEPISSPVRTFPQIADVISGTPTQGEQLPANAQTLNMRLVARDNHSGVGGVAYGLTTIDFSGTAGPFAVTAPNTGAEVWEPTTSETITWNVASTDLAPIRCTQVDIDLSIDGGNTYPTSLATATANDGSESITVPSVATSAARVRVRCALQRDTADAADVTDHFFFDISNNDFTIQPDATGCVTSLVVGSLGDSGACTLRDTIVAAATGSTITFDAGLTGGTITLASEIEITGKNLVIDGADRQITVSGGNSVRLFRIPSTANVTFRQLTLAEGLCTSASPCTAVSGFGDRHGAAVFTRFNSVTLLFDRVVFRDHQGDFGGAVFNNYAEVRFENCTFKDNLGIDGGALYVRSNYNGAGNRTTIDRTTLANNRAFDDGGGIYHDDGLLEIFNSTLSGNFTDSFSNRQGGALHTNDSFSTNRVVVDLVGSTLAGNRATEGGGIYLGATGTTFATVNVTNTLIADSTLGGDCLNTGATLVDGGSNLVEDNSCGFSGGSDPMLGPLAANGGATETHPLGVGSPAIDGGDVAVCAGALGGIDQRGYGRPPAACDIGAYEADGTAPAGAPQITAGQVFAVNEQAPIGTVVGTVAATDPDVGQTLTFSIQGGNVDNAFVIDAGTGQITVRRFQPLDPQVQPQFQLQVGVVDSGSPPLLDSEIVTVNVTDINRPPTAADATLIASSVANSGDFIGFVKASDPDPGDVLTYAITGGNTGGAFSIDSVTGDLFVANNAGFGAEPSFALGVEVTDNGTPNLSDPATITINVQDCVPQPGVVSSTGDSGPCTLRQAILDATSGATITFASNLAGATITLLSEIEITGKTLVIDGEDRDVTISGGNSVRMFRLPSATNVTFRRLTLADGLCTNASPCTEVSGFGNRHGGAVFSRFTSVTMLFDRVTFTGNQADFGGAVFNNYAEARFENCTFDDNLGIDGGAIYVRGSYNGSAGTRTTFDRSTLSNNRAFDDGGGIYHDDGRLEIYNSTLSGNFTDAFSSRQGGGLHTNDSFDTDRVVVDLVGSTLAGNSATEGGGLYIGATATALATVTLTNTLIADSPVGGDCLNTGATLVNGGSNLVEDNSCGFTGGSDPMLGTLQDNGGSTATQALQVGSPAIANGDNAVCAGAAQNGVDQRGFARDDGNCDVGAFELGATPPVLTTAIWDGGGSTENWSEAANWLGDVVPGAADTVLFDSRNRKKARVDVGFGGIIAGLTVDGYLNEIVLERSLAIQGALTLHELATVDLATQGLTVEGAVSNRGTLRQTQAVTAVGTPVEFLRLKNAADSETHYFGADITPTASSMGNVTIEVHGNQPRCTGSANDDVASRCFEVTPQTAAAATLRLYFSEAERNGQLANQIKVWHFSSGTSQWQQVGMAYSYSESDLICVEQQGEGCWVEATGINSFSPFSLGSGNVPTSPAPVPVTLASFEASQGAAGVSFRWSTATETANVGFRLYGESVEGLEPVGVALIPSRVLSSFGATDYRYEAATAATTFYLEDVDVKGRTRLQGPFELGQSYGYQAPPVAIDWPSIRAQHANSKAQRQQALVQQAQHRGLGEVPVRLLVEGDGIHRVTYEDLVAAGFDFAGTPAAELALLNRGEPVAIRVIADAVFGAGSYLEFYGQTVDSLYTKTNVYHLLADAAASLRMAEEQATPDPSLPLATSYMETVAVERDRSYFTSSPGDDPWYDTWLFARDSPASADFTFEVEGWVEGAGSSSLKLMQWGVTSWPEAPDHHSLATLNGAQVQDSTFDGAVAHESVSTLPQGLLQEGENRLTVTVPNDTGVAWDVIAVDGFAVRYPRAFVARDGQLTFMSSAASLAQRFEVDGLPSAAAVVYRLDDSGPVVLTGTTAVAGSLIFADGFESADLSAWGSGGGSFRLGFTGTGAPARYVVADPDAILRPQIEAGRPTTDIMSGAADYVAIAHPSFIDGLTPLVAARQAQGLAVKVVDVEDIYSQLAGGVFDPQAIAEYIEHAVHSMDARYVLLVGGDTYDYFDTLGTGAMSFIPSLYSSTGDLVHWAPVDPLYADVDGDELPDVALGRLPVRTETELDDVVQKTLAYETKDYGRTSIFAADGFDGQVDFGLDSELFVSYMPEGWLNERAYLDDLGVQPARQAVIDAIEEGVALTSFVGHSASTVWTFDGLFGVADARALDNADRPTVVSQWGCWNTWYVATEFDTLAHGFLVSGRGGAAAVLGATTLTDSRSERALGRRIMLHLSAPGTTLGEAIQAGKSELSLTQPGMRDVLLGWTLLGDPALVIDP